MGGTMRAARKPPVAPKVLPSQKKSFKEWGITTTPQVWHVEPGPLKEKKVLYAGTAPAGLFRSEDNGRTWGPVKGLLTHPSRKNWMPGFGGMCLHSIQVDPHDPDRIVIAISSSGAFKTEDGGKKWTPINRAVARYAGAPKDKQVGTCVHKLLQHPTEPGRLYQQNHVGVYRSDDYGSNWYRIDPGLPYDFGFGLALNAHNPDTCYVTPLEPSGYSYRATPGALRVYGWKGPNRGWRAFSKGLPQRDAYLSVLREGMASDTLKPCGIYVGTGSGQIFHSADEGSTWEVLAHYLPPVQSVSAAVID